MPTNIILDTSCIHAVLAPTLEPTLYAQIPPQSKKCKYFTGQYYRMEFLRRWIITGIEIYFRAKITSNIAETLDYFSQNFSQRENKVVIQWAAHYIASIEKYPPQEPIERFGWVVFTLANAYDIKFMNNYVPVKTGCKKGEVQIDLESPTIEKALRDFYERFIADDHKCKLDALLKVDKKCPSLHKIIKASKDDVPAKAQKAFLNLQKQIRWFIEKNQVPDCDNCKKIGDILITLEQPRNTVLYHVDNSFLALCPLLRREQKQLDSILKTSPKPPLN